jgi:mannosyltransferase OCH1-like enzyme
MIPRTINYIWVGNNEIPPIFDKCKESWERFCPEYEIKLWTEKDIDYLNISYLRFALENNRYAMFADYYRVWIIYHFGGIYLDIDVELINSLESLREIGTFFSRTKDGYINSGSCFGAEKSNHVLKHILSEYDLIDIKIDNDYIPCPVIETRVFKNLGLFDAEIQKNYRVTVLPYDYFDPYDWRYLTGKITKNTIGIHHYKGTWLDKTKRNKLQLLRALRPVIGNRLTYLLDRISDYFLRFSTCNKD